MSSIRSSARLATATRRSKVVPEFSTIMETIESSGRESLIRDQVLAVAKFYKGDVVQCLGFWFQQPGAEYNFTSEVHLTLLRCIMASLPDFGHPVTRHFLHSIASRDTLRALGIQRYRRGDEVFYRILVSDDS